MIPTRPFVTAAPLLLGPLLLSSCAAPDLGARLALRTAATVAASETLGGNGDLSAAQLAEAQWPGDAWWNSYSDPQLTALIEEGIANVPEMAAAAARLRRASALAEQAGATLLPTAEAEVEGGLTKQSYNNGLPREFLPQGWVDRGAVAVGAGLDLDLWGRNRAALAAATSDALAAAIDTRYARMLIATSIADAYAELAQLYAEHDIRDRSLAIRQETQSLVSERVRIGLDTRGDLRQADANVAAARADLVAVEEAIGLRENQIAALVGSGPDRGLSIRRPSLPDGVQHDLPPDAATGLIARRADIAAARARAEAEASRIDVARADFYPSIRLDALVGFQSLGLENLAKAGSTYGSISPAINLPLFRGGALRGQYRGARAAYDEAVANYNQTVIDAYRETADAVTSRRMLNERLTQANAALSASEEAYEIARLRYEGGLSGFLDLLVVEERLLSARERVADLEARGFALDIALIRALGGGFDAAPSTDISSKPASEDDNG